MDARVLHPARHPKPVCKESLSVDCGEVKLVGDLNIPVDATGLVLFAHGSGSSRHSPRNQFVAKIIRGKGLGTFLFDLLTREEERTDAFDGHLRFDIPFLAHRLVGATRWISHQAEARNLGVGYFGASTGGAAALVAAARLGECVEAVVSRGGRPDLAESSLPQVKSPTLLIVGEYDDQVLELNQRAYKRLSCEKRIEIIPRATHLFEEPGALEEVAERATQWFHQHLRKSLRTPQHAANDI